MSLSIYSLNYAGYSHKKTYPATKVIPFSKSNLKFTGASGSSSNPFPESDPNYYLWKQVRPCKDGSCDLRLFSTQKIAAANEYGAYLKSNGQYNKTTVDEVKAIPNKVLADLAKQKYQTATPVNPDNPYPVSDPKHYLYNQAEPCPTGTCYIKHFNGERYNAANEYGKYLKSTGADQATINKAIAAVKGTDRSILEEMAKQKYEAMYNGSTPTDVETGGCKNGLCSVEELKETANKTANISNEAKTITADTKDTNSVIKTIATDTKDTNSVVKTITADASTSKNLNEITLRDLPGLALKSVQEFKPTDLNKQAIPPEFISWVGSEFHNGISYFSQLSHLAQVAIAFIIVAAVWKKATE